MGLKLPKAFNYRLSHQDKAGFTVNIQTEHREGGGGGYGVNGRITDNGESSQQQTKVNMKNQCEQVTSEQMVGTQSISDCWIDFEKEELKSQSSLCIVVQ